MIVTDEDGYTVSVRVGDRVRHTHSGRLGTVTGDAEPDDHSTADITGFAHTHWDGYDQPSLIGVAVAFLAAA